MATCEHLYSRSMDQPYPRKCLKCGKVEPTTIHTPVKPVPATTKKEEAPDIVIERVFISKRHDDKSFLGAACNATVRVKGLGELSPNNFKLSENLMKQLEAEVLAQVNKKLGRS